PGERPRSPRVDRPAVDRATRGTRSRPSLRGLGAPLSLPNLWALRGPCARAESSMMVSVGRRRHRREALANPLCEKGRKARAEDLIGPIRVRRKCRSLEVMDINPEIDRNGMIV